jgi:hypothetical protein
MVIFAVESDDADRQISLSRVDMLNRGKISFTSNVYR